MALRHVNEAPIIDSQGEQTNPTTATVLADSGAVPGSGIYEVTIVANASAAFQALVQRRNAANDATVGDVVGLYIPANSTAQFVLPYFLDVSERVRVLPDDNLTGTAWVSLFAQRVA